MADSARAGGLGRKAPSKRLSPATSVGSAEVGCMTAIAPAARHLRLVDDPGTGWGEGAPVTMSWFCGHCGAAPARVDGGGSGGPRVCPSCSLGVLLRTRSDVAPAADGAFLVVDSSLSVQAVSARAELVLAVREVEAVNRHVSELLIAGDAKPATTVGLALAITRAAAGDERVESLRVRPGNVFAVRLRADHVMRAAAGGIGGFGVGVLAGGFAPPLRQTGREHARTHQHQIEHPKRQTARVALIA